jgi:hypothetical protein
MATAGLIASMGGDGRCPHHFRRDGAARRIAWMKSRDERRADQCFRG